MLGTHPLSLTEIRWGPYFLCRQPCLCPERLPLLYHPHSYKVENIYSYTECHQNPEPCMFHLTNRRNARPCQEAGPQQQRRKQTIIIGAGESGVAHRAQAWHWGGPWGLCPGVLPVSYFVLGYCQVKEKACAEVLFRIPWESWVGSRWWRGPETCFQTSVHTTSHFALKHGLWWQILLVDHHLCLAKSQPVSFCRHHTLLELNF